MICGSWWDSYPRLPISSELLHQLSYRYVRTLTEHLFINVHKRLINNIRYKLTEIMLTKVKTYTHINRESNTEKYNLVYYVFLLQCKQNNSMKAMNMIR